MSLDPDKRGIFVFREQRSRFPVVVIGAVPVPDNVPSNEIAEQIRDRLAKSGDRSEPAALRELNHKGRLHRILDYRRDVITSGFFFEYPNFVDYVAVRGKTAWVLRYITNRPELNYAAHNLDSTLADMVDGFRPVKKQPTRSIGKFSYRVPGGPNWFVCVNFTRFTPEDIQTEILMRLFEGPANGAFLLSRAPSINLARVTAGPVAETAGDAQSTIREIADDIKRFYQRGGFRDLQFSETADPALGSHCRRTEWTVERPARASLPIMDMRAKGLICVHPDDPKRIIQMLVSQRKVKGGKFPDIEKSTEGFLGGLKFLPIKKP
jgi:hypothetical protein